MNILKSVDSTPYADACARGFMVKSGSCRGATVFVKAIGIYPSVIDVQVTGKPLAATSPGKKKKRKKRRKKLRDRELNPGHPRDRRIY